MPDLLWWPLGEMWGPTVVALAAIGFLLAVALLGLASAWERRHFDQLRADLAARYGPPVLAPLPESFFEPLYPPLNDAPGPFTRALYPEGDIS